MVYAAKILRDLKVDMSEFCLLLTCTVMEEDCDGLCWQYIVNEDKIRPDVGRRHRLDRLQDPPRPARPDGDRRHHATASSCHGSMPDKGDNAVYKIATIVREIEELHKHRLKSDRVPRQGHDHGQPHRVQDRRASAPCPARPTSISIAASPSATRSKSAVAEVKDAVKRAGVKADVEVLRYAVPSYTGLVYETEKYFPTWCEDEDSLPVQAAVKTHHEVLGKPPIVHRWTFSTNAVSIDGMFGIPCVGFGPAPESVAHTVNDTVPIEHLVKCAAFYAGFGPSLLRPRRRPPQQNQHDSSNTRNNRHRCLPRRHRGHRVEREKHNLIRLILSISASLCLCG